MNINKVLNTPFFYQLYIKNFRSTFTTSVLYLQAVIDHCFKKLILLMNQQCCSVIQSLFLGKCVNKQLQEIHKKSVDPVSCAIS